MGVAADRVREIIRTSRVPVSLEAPGGEGDDSFLGEMIEDQAAVEPLAAASVAERRSQIERLLDALTARERIVSSCASACATAGRTRSKRWATRSACRASAPARSSPRPWPSCAASATPSTCATRSSSRRRGGSPRRLRPVGDSPHRGILVACSVTQTRRSSRPRRSSGCARLTGSWAPGFPVAAARLFEQDTDAQGGEWYVKVFGRLVRSLRVDDMTSSDLFALPPTWEVMRAEVRALKAGRGFVTVTGFMYCRPRGSWEHLRVPLLHVWTIGVGRLQRFENLLDGIELSPAVSASRGAA